MSDRDRDLEERQTEALEAIATELRYQNAAIAELLMTIDDLAARVDERPYEYEPRDRSGRRIQTDINSRLFERDQREDDRPEFAWGDPENWRDSE